MEDTSDLEARVRAGNYAALAVLTDRWRDRLRAHLTPQIGADLRKRIDPDDVIQEALVSALSALRRTSLAGQSVYEWLRRIADARLLDLARRHSAARRAAGREVAPAPSRHLADWLAVSLSTPSGAVMRDEQETRLRARLAALQEDTRELLRLRYAEGLPTKDIAARVNRTDAAVRKALSRALADLRHGTGDSLRS
jgi:RNA polymerase sigma-70 factor (subfamily 1)